MKPNIILSASCLLAVILFPAWGQSDVARIIGTVTDSSGAVINAGTITVKNDKTGEERIVNVNAQGVYIVTPLRPASYSVVARAEGMGTAEYRGIHLQVGQERTVNIVMEPAAVTTEIKISGGELVNIDVSSARIGVNVSEREVAQLPLNGRQISQLYLLTPGAVNNGSGAFDDIRFSGRSNQQNAIRFDGIEGTSIVDASPGNLNGETSSAFRLQTSLENVQEFRVDSNSYPAEYGTGTGGQVSVITKSGSNNLHGSLFEYVRNNAIDARNFFDGAGNAPLRLNQFGGSVGGPVVKEKAFFFASYEGLRQRVGIPFVETTPSASARLRATPAIQPLLAAFPVGQTPSASPDFDVVRVQGQSAVDENAGGVRFDYNLSPKYRLYARYFRDQGDAFAHQNSTLSAYSVTAVPQNAVLNFQQILTPATINETKFGFNGTKTRINGIAPLVPGLNLTGAVINITGSVALSGIAGQAGSAGVAIPTGLVRTNSATNGRGAPYTNYSLSFVDNLSLIRGAHNLKLGVEIRPIRIYSDRLGGTTYTFSNLNDFLTNRPSSIQFLGDVSARSPFTGLSGEMDLSQVYYIGYAQDEWKITPTLTMNYGLRYEYYTVLHEARNKDVVFNTVSGQIDPSSKPWYATSPFNFGPRLALSWAPRRFGNKTVFRVGSGYYYGPGQTEDQLQPAESDRISTTVSSGPLLAYPLDTAAIAAGYDITNPKLGYQPRAYAPGYRIPERVLSYTASVQQQLPANAVLTVAYVGSQGRNLFLRSVTNQITGVTTDPKTGKAIVTRQFGDRFAEIDYKTSGGTDHYDSLQTTLNRRFAHGFTLGSQYTWAHSLGNTDGSNEARTAANNFNFEADRGNNNFDVRHSFNLSTLYELPFGKGRRYGGSMGPLPDALVGGWQLGGIVNARSGLPIEVLITRPDVVFRDNRNGAIVTSPILGADGTVYTTAIINVPGGGNSRNIRRPDVVPGVNPYLDNDRGFLNPAAFAIPSPGTFGNLGRNAFHGPDLVQFDLTLDKNFRLSERFSLQLRSEFYNIFNHTNFSNPAGGQPRLNNALGAGNNQLQPGQPFTAAAAGGNFGVLTSTVSNLIGVGTNRQIQFALRLNF
jgi:hypothetical protein